MDGPQPVASVYLLQSSATGDILTSSPATSPILMQCSSDASIGLGSGSPLPWSAGYFAYYATGISQNMVSQGSAPPWAFDAARSQRVNLADLRSYRTYRPAQYMERTLLISDSGQVSSAPTPWRSTWEGPASNGRWAAARTLPHLHAKFENWNSAPD